MPYGLLITKPERDLIELIWPKPTEGFPVNRGRFTNFSPAKGRTILEQLQAYQLDDPDDQATRHRLMTRIIDLCGSRLLDFDLPVDKSDEMDDKEDVAEGHD